MADNSKPIASYALNDRVYEAQWDTDDEWQVEYSARFIGGSGDNTLYFRMRRMNYRKEAQYSGTGTFRIQMPSGSIPQFWEVRIPMRERGDILVAAAAWRFGEGPDDVELRYYSLSDNGVLFETGPPAEVRQRPIGFRAAIEDHKE